MNFEEFSTHRRKLLEKDSGLLDCAETNLYGALAALKPAEQEGTGVHVHRCHLASEWAEYYGLPPEISRRALISCGVRHSLELIYRRCVEDGAKVWLPDDNYPVFHALAHAVGLKYEVFPTLPETHWPSKKPVDSAEYLLVTNPIKPRGRWLNEADVESLTQWLNHSERRRLILDTVYNLDSRFHPTTMKLEATGQTLVLHSMTKGWLQPRLFGVALVPERDADIWLPLFRAVCPPQSNLRQARRMMREQKTLPAQVVSALKHAKKAMSVALPDVIPCEFPVELSSYFFPVHANWRELLRRNVLGLPVSVFGSSREDITICLGP